MKKKVLDKKKNKLVIKEGIVKLSLANEMEDGHRKWKKIGRIKMIADGISVYQKHTKYIFRKFKAFGFCYEAIETINPTYVQVIYKGEEAKKGSYSIATNILRNKAKFLNFKKKGFELQCFVPIKEFLYERKRKK